jgi:hypothetical protein
MISEAIQSALIVSLAPTITSVAALIVSIRTHGKVVEVKHEFNDRMTQFLAAKDQLADARVNAGYAKGKADQRDLMK